MSLAAYLHQLDPFAIQFSDNLGIRWYGLSYIAGFVAAFLIVRWLSNRQRSLVPPAKAADFILAIAIGTIIGGRLGYCIFYKPHLLIEFYDEAPFWGVFALNKGGMASHGGIIGIILACVIFAYRNKFPKLHATDLVALTGPIGITFGRIANFINGELYGRACDPNFSLAVKFPQEIAAWQSKTNPNHQLFINKVEPLIAKTEAIHGLREGAGSIQLLLDTARNNVTLQTELASILTPRHPSQLYQAALEGLLLFVVIFIIWRKPRKTGVVSGCFLVGYAIMRIIGERFRLPDAHIGYEALGLTRGQWLSVAMLAAGIFCIIFWSRKDAPKLGGWANAKLPPTSNNSKS